MGINSKVPDGKRSKRKHDDGARLADAQPVNQDLATSTHEQSLQDDGAGSANAQPVNGDLTTSTREQRLQEIVFEMRLNPPLLPSWTSDAQHDPWCECVECTDHYRTLAIGALWQLAALHGSQLNEWI